MNYQINDNFEFHLHKEDEWCLDVHLGKAMMCFFALSEPELGVFIADLRSVITAQLFAGENLATMFTRTIKAGQGFFELQFDECWEVHHNGMFLWLEANELITLVKFLDKRHSPENWAAEL